MEEKIVIAPFVMKTYQMVNDPCTDHLIGWGPANNSILVIDPMEFSHRILPSFFKHHNFSSFVRQLNTYGFRKMDPDKWEFANKWFLRGQKHLLSNISHRRYTPPPSPPPPHHHHLDRGEDHHDPMAEIGRLRKEQTSLDNEIQIMNQRLDSTERRPKQMIIFLRKIIEDPEIMTRVIMRRVPPLGAFNSSGQFRHSIITLIPQSLKLTHVMGHLDWAMNSIFVRIKELIIANGLIVGLWPN